MHRQRDIILIPIPFYGFSFPEETPCDYNSSDKYNDANEDVVVVALTSNIEPRNFTVTLTGSDLENGEPKVTSMIRADKIYTLNKSIVIKTFGRVTPVILAKIKGSILKLIEQPDIPNS